MGKQKKISEVVGLDQHEIDEIKYIVDLEKKYQEKLWSLFNSEDFEDDLKEIELYLQTFYNQVSDTYDIKNKLKVAAERLCMYNVYRRFSFYEVEVYKIYPSPISGDCAFIVEDAVINLDIKTLDTKGNKNDIHNLQFLPNQSSFRNINLDSDSNVENSGVVVESLIPPYYEHSGVKYPILTYFLTIVYTDDKVSFSLCREEKYETIHLYSLPNGQTSILFDYDLIHNLKTYRYYGQKDGFAPILIKENSSLEVANSEISKIAERYPGYILINGRTKKGLFDPNTLHPRYRTKGISWFPVSKKVPNTKPTKYDFYLKAVKNGELARIDCEIIKIRYDSKGSVWYGCCKKTI